MRVITLIAVLFVFIACGSRKVDIQNRIKELESNLSIKLQELEIERKKLYEYMYSENFRADSIVETADKRTIYNPTSDKKKSGKEEITESKKNKETEINNNLSESNTESNKKTDREQFNVFKSIIQFWPVLLILFIIILFRKNIHRFK